MDSDRAALHAGCMVLVRIEGRYGDAALQPTAVTFTSIGLGDDAASVNANLQSLRRSHSSLALPIPSG